MNLATMRRNLLMSTTEVVRAIAMCVNRINKMRSENDPHVTCSKLQCGHNTNNKKGKKVLLNFQRDRPNIGI